MEPLSPLSSHHSQQKQEITPNPVFWKEFFTNSDQRKQFLRTVQNDFSHMIARHMRKSKEAMQRLRESFR